MEKETLCTLSSIRTFSGIYIDVLNPTEEMINIEDIAHSLSNQCRFGGHLPEFYSVAQHCMFCSEISLDTNKLAALMHDASEAYLIDVPRPVKNNLSNYKEIEDNLMKLISKKYKFQYPFHKDIKIVDDIALKTEWNCLMIKNCERNILLKNMSFEESKNEFLKMFNYLVNKKEKVSC